MTRQIILDTETTGFEPKEGHRIIEIGCVEMINRRLTGHNMHLYLNPDREIDAGATKVHGISSQFLADKPRFVDIVDSLMSYLSGAELVIHNAAFDIGFLNHELILSASYRWQVITDHCTVLDSLQLARDKHRGQRNSLDALCKRYDISNEHRQLHGALLDAELLALVYLALTGGQRQLFSGLDNDGVHDDAAFGKKKTWQRPAQLTVVKATADELAADAAYFSA